MKTPSLAAIATLACSAALAGFAPVAQAADIAAAPATPPAGEHLGTVSFPVSCAPAVRESFTRGVALLHDFWYEDAQRQFEQILTSDPTCSMAHWGVAMSMFHQIWERPDAHVEARAEAEMKAAAAHPAKTVRERTYVAALGGFFTPGNRDYQARVDAYSAAMAKLYADNPADVDAGAFYALSLLASAAPTDTSLTHEHKAMAVLNPLFAKYPDHPGVVHYIIHACDTPSMAPDALAASKHYGEIASSAPHAVHMPGHIFARLGMWRDDIAVNRASVEASKAADARHQSGAMDQFHSDDFLLYAYLQSGEDAAARAILADSSAALSRFESMPEMGDHYMTGMFPYYRAKLPIFFALEMRDWKAASGLKPVPGAPAETQTQVYWARAIADGHLHRAGEARADLAAYDELVEKIKQGPHAYFADSTGSKITRGEISAWEAFAAGSGSTAIEQMRASADLQDKVGQGEVDIPAREMLADMLLESGHAQEALTEYEAALRSSPKRFNGLFNAGRAAEAVGDKKRAKANFAALLEQTDQGSHSARAEFAHAKAFVSSTTLAER
jgi:tetratricopeptide (TPR) repeat protein